MMLCSETKNVSEGRGQFAWILLFPALFSSVFPTPQRQPELITSECTP